MRIISDIVLILDINGQNKFETLVTEDTGQLGGRYRVCLWSGGLRFKSRAGQIGYSFANGSPPQRYFFRRGCVAANAMTR